MRILAIDPGERVGWATGHVVADLADGSTRIGVLNHGITALKPFAVKLGTSFAGYDVVVYETFRLRANVARKFAGNDMQTSQLIGVIRYLSWLHPHVKLVGQGPAIKSTAEKTLPDDIQAIIAGLPKAHDDSHDGDALLHLWHWYWSKYI